MITIVKESATPAQLEHFVSWTQDRGFRTNVSQGENETIVGIIGDTSRIDPLLLEPMGIVEEVRCVSDPFKKANRTFHPEDTAIDCGHGVRIGGGNFHVIAGPRCVEGESIHRIAEVAKAARATLLRGSPYRSSTNPYSYQGMSAAGLGLLARVGHDVGMPIMDEVMDTRDVGLFVDKGIDVMQISTRNAQDFALLREVGRTRVPVLPKRGRSETIDELLMVAEHVMSEGNSRVMLCERGIRTFEARTRYTFDVNAIPTLHRLSHLPVIADLSHAAGSRRYAAPVAPAACAAGADGLMVEVHDNPNEARSGGATALTPEGFATTMRRVSLVRDAVTTRLEA